MTHEKKKAGSGRGGYFKTLAQNHPEKMREIASKGGKTSQENGTAHLWTAQDGRDANSLRKVRGHRGSRGSS